MVEKLGPPGTAQGLPILHMAHMIWGPIYDNGTSNALKSPLTTELRTLEPIFGIRRQNIFEKHFLVENGLHPRTSSMKSKTRFLILKYLNFSIRIYDLI